MKAAKGLLFLSVVLAVGVIGAHGQCVPGNLTAPQNVHSSPIAVVKVGLNWDPVPGALGYQLQGGNVGSTSLLNVFLPGQTTNFLEARDLDDTTCYFWRVRALCTASTGGPWSVIDTFCTLACHAPDMLSSSLNPSGITVRLRWNLVPGGLAYIIRGGPPGNPNAGSFIVTDPTIDSLDTQSLPSGTYEWQVQSGCKVSPIVLSPWSALATFVIPGATEKMEPELPKSFELYPNPAVNRVNVALPDVAPDADVRLSLLDLAGRILWEDSREATSTISLSLDEFPNGVYQLAVEADGTRNVQRLVVQR